VSRFLIVTLPLTGHAYRALAVADELGARGHEVAWCGPKGYFTPLLGPDATLFPTGTRLLAWMPGCALSWRHCAANPASPTAASTQGPDHRRHPGHRSGGRFLPACRRRCRSPRQHGAVVRAGAGIRVPFNRVRPSQLRETLVSILDDPSCRHAAMSIKDSFEAAGGAPTAAARLECLVQVAR